MKSTYSIDVSTCRVNAYDPDPPITVAVGNHEVTISLVNVPEDLKPQLERWSEKYTALETAKRDERDAKNTKIAELQERVRQLQAANDNDVERPTLENATLKEMLSLIRTRSFADNQLNRIMLLRLVTGWGLQQARTFEEANTPAVQVADF